ncbi:glycosyltransferase involved in cell wall biosynthesis [Geodermatophilus normandii]|uniref:Glycosyltransferase involved in cell wall biosynthesis n=1 Tax=Geodermatophilus normandii TaxID=1137989 RepID=A0A317QIE7_9ACTN|nr:glycosyltransferase family 4 protein [Geodermatophilus normandii]PWW21370.1 glycosyltransferase involved in cell wall biosynthesis [Geodermatophilus normandii]
MSQRSKARVLVIVQNLPVPLDRRVWLECQALVAEGIGVSVICPKGPGDPSFAVIDGVPVYKYRPAPATSGALSYLFEFVYCWIRTALLSLRVWRRDGFSVIQACNPPDTYWLLARLWRTRGVRFVYDQHDLNPEVFRSRFGEPRGVRARLEYGALTWLERCTYRAADEVISTNESYRRVAVTRGNCDPDHVTVVRSGPDTSRMRPRPPEPGLRHDRSLLVYLGIMGPQDGVDIALHAMAELVHERGREDVHLALLGFGDSLGDLRRLATELRLDDHVTFTGRADTEMIARYLSTAVVGLCPDPSSPLNDVSTMNKVMEYMSYAVPVVAFDLTETRVSAGDTGVLVDPRAGAAGLADAVAALLDDPDRRIALSLAARQRAVEDLDWAQQAIRYVGVHRRALGMADAVGSVRPRGVRAAAPAESGADLLRALVATRMPAGAGQDDDRGDWMLPSPRPAAGTESWRADRSGTTDSHTVRPTAADLEPVAVTGPLGPAASRSVDPEPLA